MRQPVNWQGSESPNRPKVVMQFVQNPVRMFEPSPGCAVGRSQIPLYGTSIQGGQYGTSIQGGHRVATREEEEQMATTSATVTATESGLQELAKRHLWM